MNEKTIKIGDTVKYTSYGKTMSAKVTHISHNGGILFLNNKRWIHAISVIE